MILAEVSSGRSDFDNSSPTKDDNPGSDAAGTSSIDAVAPPPPVAWNAAVRTVMTFLASCDFTVWIALPA